MLVSTSQVPTDRPARYMAQMCKHFAHKNEASYDDTSGRIQFAYGTCILETGDDVLRLRVETDEEASLERLENVVGKHLERFMWRETPKIAWSRG